MPTHCSLGFIVFATIKGKRMTFKVGDTVQLKSGGPVMTVGYVKSDGGLECHWFNSNAGAFEAKWNAFKPEMLAAVNMAG